MAEDDNNQQTDARLRRALRAKQAAGGQRTKKHRADWAGESAAIYCRISHVNDDNQTGVERQESICREVADRLGLIVDEDQVFVDNNRSAWQRKRKRPGWDALLAEANEGRVRHVLTYHPGRLMRQPHDLEELLQIADDHDITLHGQANRRDLADPTTASSCGSMLEAVEAGHVADQTHSVGALKEGIRPTKRRRGMGVKLRGFQ
ncbi:recombinase family protein [Streptomyces sp. NPDC000618]|uniref:recombinase family protein n=1 Tax=Streptomyces sp. NPDC000618 TaxID=3154265 RepID=UPI003328E475